MFSKFQFLIVFLVLPSVFSGCTKKTKVVPATPHIYYASKISGLRYWAGTYEDNSTSYPYNDTFALKAASASIILISRANRLEKLEYGETNEVEKTIIYTGTYHTTNGANNYDYFFQLTYHYLDDQLDYEESYAYNDYGKIYYISDLFLHSF